MTGRSRHSRLEILSRASRPYPPRTESPQPTTSKRENALQRRSVRCVRFLETVLPRNSFRNSVSILPRYEELILFGWGLLAGDGLNLHPALCPPRHGVSKSSTVSGAGCGGHLSQGAPSRRQLVERG